MAETERSLSALRAWLQAALPGTMVPAEVLARALAEVHDGHADTAPAGQPSTWRERLWTVPPETRIGVAELCEALGRSKGWVWRHTGPKAPGVRIPHRKLEGELVFVVGEVRAWIPQHESVVVPGRDTALVVQRNRRASV